jgi:hypothetical protein
VNATRIAIVLVGISLPYLARLPRGSSWLAQYLHLGLGAQLFLGAFNAIAWGAVLILSLKLRRPALSLIPLALGSGYLGYAHYNLDLASDAQAAVALVFIPIYALVPILVGGTVAYFLDSRRPRHAPWP